MTSHLCHLWRRRLLLAKATTRVTLRSIVCCGCDVYVCRVGRFGPAKLDLSCALGCTCAAHGGTSRFRSPCPASKANLRLAGPAPAATKDGILANDTDLSLPDRR